MPGHYGDKEKTKTKTVTKRKNGKVVTKSKTTTKTRGGKKKAQGNNMEVGRLLKGLANSSKGNDPYDSEMSDRSFRKFDAERDMKEQAEIRQQLKRKSTKVK
jgi:hypothetical protein